MEKDKFEKLYTETVIGREKRLMRMVEAMRVAYRLSDKDARELLWFYRTGEGNLSCFQSTSSQCLAVG